MVFIAPVRLDTLKYYKDSWTSHAGNAHFTLQSSTDQSPRARKKVWFYPAKAPASSPPVGASRKPVLDFQVWRPIFTMKTFIIVSDTVYYVYQWDRVRCCRR